MPNPVDCLVVGAGPAGATAALYLARFRRTALVIDEGDSRASWIPRTRNYPGFPEGIAGKDLLTHIRRQARLYGARFKSGSVVQIQPLPSGYFEISTKTLTFVAKTVLVATGIIDNLPDMANPREAVACGVVRLCPVCDAFEVRGKKVAILAGGADGAKHALFMRTYTREVTLAMIAGATPLTASHLVELRRAGVAVVEDVLAQVKLIDGRAVIMTSGMPGREFDVVYPALGCQTQTGLLPPGVRQNEIGELLVDEFQQTSVGGLYAAGDVVRGLNQISVATAQAAIAASHIHTILETNFT